jgi:hypothetical protein
VWRCRKLRLREDTAKYLENLDLAGAIYDPKSRSMRDEEEEEQSPSLCLLDAARASKDGAAGPKYGAKYYGKYLEKKMEKKGKKVSEPLRGEKEKYQPLFNKAAASEVLHRQQTLMAPSPDSASITAELADVNDLFRQLSSLVQVRTADPIHALQHALTRHTWHNTRDTQLDATQHRSNRLSSIVLKATSIPARRL